MAMPAIPFIHFCLRHFHVSRHTYATLQMAASSNPYIVSQFLTHKNLGTTLRHSHDVPMALIDTIGKIPLKPKG